jgi:hypothetical protein
MLTLLSLPPDFVPVCTGLERIIYEKRCMGFELISEKVFAYNQAQGRGLEIWVPVDAHLRTVDEDAEMCRMRAEYQNAHQVGQVSCTAGGT